MERFKVIIPKKIALREHLNFFYIVNSKAYNNHSVSVLKPYFFVLVCLPIRLH